MEGLSDAGSIPARSIVSKFDFAGFYQQNRTFFILHRAIFVILIVRYARKVKLAFIVSTISR